MFVSLAGQDRAEHPGHAGSAAAIILRRPLPFADVATTALSGTLLADSLVLWLASWLGQDTGIDIAKSSAHNIFTTAAAFNIIQNHVDLPSGKEHTTP